VEIRESEVQRKAAEEAAWEQAKSAYQPADKNQEKNWQMCFSQLRFQLDRVSFGWLKDARLLGMDGEVYVVAVRSNQAWEMCQHRLYRNIAAVMRLATGHPVELRFENVSTNTSELPAFMRVG
jgi:hypothetical protein